MYYADGFLSWAGIGGVYLREIQQDGHIAKFTAVPYSKFALIEGS